MKRNTESVNSEIKRNDYTQGYQMPTCYTQRLLKKTPEYLVKIKIEDYALLPWGRKNTAIQQLIGLELHAEGIAVVSKKQRSDGPSIDNMAFISGDTDAERFAHLQQYVHNHKLKNIGCNLVLPQSAYQLFLLEAPDVPDIEMRDAIRWRLKDLVTLPMDKIALDICWLPKDILRGGKKNLYVVVANRDYLLGLIEQLQSTGLKLKAIDIAELALRNLAICLVDPQFDVRGVAVVRIKRGSGSITIYRGGSLYLSRQFDLDYGGGLLDDLPSDILTLELQRSLDYYERQLGQASPSVLYIGGENIQENKLTPSLRANLATPVQYLDFAGAVNIATATDSGIMQLCVVAAGAALRREFDA